MAPYLLIQYLKAGSYKTVLYVFLNIHTYTGTYMYYVMFNDVYALSKFWVYYVHFYA